MRQIIDIDIDTPPPDDLINLIKWNIIFAAYISVLTY